MIASLVKKELRLQRSGLYIPFAFTLLGVLLFAVGIVAGFPVDDSQVLFVLPAALLIMTLLVLYPFMAGAATLAQERFHGTLEWQLVQPISRRRQWLAKVGTAALLVALASGVGLELVSIVFANGLLRMGPHPDSEMVSIFAVHNLLRGVPPVFLVLFFFSLGVYASTLAGDAFRAFVVSALLVAVTALLWWTADPLFVLAPILIGGTRFPHPWPVGFVYLALGVCAAVLAYFNAGIQRVGWRRLLAHLGLWALVIVIATELGLRGVYYVNFHARADTTVPGVTCLFNLGESRSPGPLVSLVTRLPGKSMMLGSVEWRDDGLAYQIRARWPMTVDLASGRVAAYPRYCQKYPSFQFMASDGSYFVINTNHGMMTPGFPFPFNHFRGLDGTLRGILQRRHDSTEIPMSSSWVEDFGIIDVSGRVEYLKRHSLQRILDDPPIIVAYTQLGTDLITPATDAPHLYHLIDQIERGRDSAAQFHVTADGRWYCKYNVQRDDPSIHLERIDHSETREISFPGKIVRLTQGRILPVSPDGRWLALHTRHADKGPYEICAYRLNTGATWRLGGQWAHDVEWDGSGTLAALLLNLDTGRGSLLLYRLANGGDALEALGSISLPGKDIYSIQFLDADTILASGPLSLWRIDLTKVQPEPLPQPVQISP